MGNLGRKFRRRKAARERSLCLFWLNADGEPDVLAGPTHDLDCIFMGGASPDGCFACYLANEAAAAIWSSGKHQKIRNVDEGYCVWLVPDNETRLFDAVKAGERRGAGPHWHLQREDGREMYFFLLGEDHNREHHADEVRA
jgi:hypothetical protein